MSEIGTVTQEIQQNTESAFNKRIDQIINKKPFRSTTDQAILNELSNSTITPEKAASLSLVGIIETIQKQYNDNSAIERIKDHGQAIVNTARYLTQRIDDNIITMGTNTAKTLSVQLYNYGISLVNGEVLNPVKNFSQIPRVRKLSQEQTQTADHLLGIDRFFKPSTKLGNDIESQRKQILNDFFSDVNRTVTSLLEPISPHREQITEAIEVTIKKPIEELENSIARHETETLSTEIPLSLRGITQEIANYYNININELSNRPRTYVLKRMLENIRERSDITPEEIGNWEKQIAQKIQSKVDATVAKEKSKTDQKLPEYQPEDKYYYTKAAKLVANLMKKAGLECLIGNTSNTSGLFLMTTDAKVFLMDMSKAIPSRFTDVTNSIQQSTLFTQTPKPEGTKVTIKNEKSPSYTLYTSEEGSRIITLFNMALDYHKRTSYPFRKNEATPERRLSNYQKSIKAFEMIVTPNLQDENILYEYGETLLKYATDKDINPNQDETTLQKAAKTFYQITLLNRDNYQALTRLADIFNMSSLQEDRKKATEIYKQAQAAKQRQKSAA